MASDCEINAVRRSGFGRHVITFLLVLAFAFQSYLTQTHIHGTSPAPAQVCAAKCVAHAPLNKAPQPGETTTDCPLCQAIVHAGAFFTPAALTFFVPHVWIQTSVQAAKPNALRVAQPRNGLSRAPPR